MKYKLTGETIDYLGHTLHRIEALKDFADVNKGDKGGFVEGEHNLSQSGNCWIYDNAKVFGKAEVCNWAKVSGCAKVCDRAIVFKNAVVCGSATVSGSAEVFDSAMICGNAMVSGSAKVGDDAKVDGWAIVSGRATVGDDAKVCGTAYIQSLADYIYIKGLGSEHRGTTVFRDRDYGVAVKCGCFYGSLDMFENRSKKHTKTINSQLNI